MGKKKIVCACEDFTSKDKALYEFDSLALSTNPDKKINTEISDIMEVIESSNLINSDKTKKIFWDMFVVDALIGNKWYNIRLGLKCPNLITINSTFISEKYYS